MQLDSQQSFALAFRHLDSFSLPGIGTFVRRRAAAQIDHQTKRILPPQERFALEPEQPQPQALADFLERYYKLAPEQAQAHATQVSDWVQERLQEVGLIQVEGYGKLRKEEGSDAEFVAEDSIFGQGNDLFGLQAVDYTVGDSAKPSLEKKKAAVQTSTLANSTVVEPVRPRRRFPFGWMFFLLLLGGAGWAAWHWKDELKIQLQNAGLIKKESQDSTPLPPEPKGELVLSDSLEAIRQAMLADSLAKVQTAYEDSLHKADSVRLAMEAAKVKDQPKPVVKPEPKPVVKPEPKPVVKPEPKPVVKTEPKPVATNGSSVGVAAQRGIYYLVVSSVADPQEAKDIAARSGGAKILAPNAGGLHKISVFESGKKADVIAKMVEYKTRYPKSWIFWVGM